jgi:protein-tyrosine phosphatase
VAPFAFVDCHSHVVPSADDGARSIADGAELCVDACRHGTRLLFATPHVWPQLPLTVERQRAIEDAYDVLCARVGLELRLGYEITPTRALLADDLDRYMLAGTDCVLLDTPFTGPLDLLVAVGERAESQGLQPVIAHPERADASQADPAVVEELAGRGWPLQVNATSLLGRHGDEAAELGWDLVTSGLAALVASDGHRLSRPARLDEAFAAVTPRVGEEARRLFDGSALGIAFRTEAAVGSRPR